MLIIDLMYDMPFFIFNRNLQNASRAIDTNPRH